MNRPPIAVSAQPHTVWGETIDRQSSVKVRTRTAIEVLLLVALINAGMLKSGLESSGILSPVDLTVLLSALCVGAAGLRLLTGQKISPRLAFGVVTLALILLSAVWSSGSSYAVLKLTSGIVISMVLLATAPLLVTENYGRRTFFIGIVGIGILLEIWALLVYTGARLTLGDATIGLARALGLSSLLILVSIVHGRFPIWRIGLLFAIVGLLLYGIFATGSRGPVLGLIGAIFIIIVRASKGSLSLRLRLPFIVSMFGLLGYVGFTLSPDASTRRFLEDRESNSSDLRSEAYERSLDYIAREPFGTGLGDFGTVIDTMSFNERQYPHNIFLEIGTESGWVALGAFMALVLYLIYRVRAWGQNQQVDLFLATLLYVLINACFSGDLADNRAFWAYAGIILATRGLGSDLFRGTSASGESFGTRPVVEVLV